jgi:acyl-CoA synthetase (AMP-forming)/AMP-acid ligase II
VFVSWLPVYHDMGLILKTMVPFYLGARLHLMPASLRRVHHWPELIERYRGTFTAAPDIAYRLCIRSMRHKKHDLSSLRVALNAAEPVRLETIQAFEAHFGLVQVMVAGYGLAEATVGVCMWTPGQAPEVDADRHVSVEIKIVADEQPVEAGAVGEIMIRSPANTQGYFENPEATRSLFWNTDYIRSGDLGYLNENGELFIVGRKKNIIIHAGETIYPADVEELVNTLPNVRYSVAVGIDRGGIEGEQVYVFVESWGSTRSDDGFQDLVIEIVDRFYQRFGFRPGRVYIVKPRTIPVTPNGKMQHLRLKDLYLSGSLSRDKQILYPEY